MEKIHFRISLVQGDNCTSFNFTGYHEMISFIKTAFEHVDSPQKCSFVIHYLRKEAEVDG